ncbi:hypothetical protein BDN71DRAFT_1430578 [Pleurotus eryngii]|uniref:Uncharacterized protein n=1 Tax=Pleurotus eryngii TaxID=5323 RepID=A0A9P5ZX27_PLEER|nr:hypothetical protein BDN71DRAFT_1430578 [Pleurotus eryngii]
MLTRLDSNLDPVFIAVWIARLGRLNLWSRASHARFVRSARQISSFRPHRQTHQRFDEHALFRFSYTFAPASEPSVLFDAPTPLLRGQSTKRASFICATIRRIEVHHHPIPSHLSYFNISIFSSQNPSTRSSRPDQHHSLDDGAHPASSLHTSRDEGCSAWEGEGVYYPVTSVGTPVLAGRCRANVRIPAFKSICGIRPYANVGLASCDDRRGEMDMGGPQSQSRPSNGLQRMLHPPHVDDYGPTLLPLVLRLLRRGAHSDSFCWDVGMGGGVGASRFVVLPLAALGVACLLDVGEVWFVT